MTRIPLRVRYWKYVEKTDSCWLWTGATMAGYGRIRDDEHRMSGAHRIAWEWNHGAIPEGMVVCHRCDVRRCVNPAHLFLGTVKDNIRDGIKKGRIDVYRISRHGKQPRGEAHVDAKLTEHDVRAIREMRGRKPPVQFAEIARLFPVTPTQACRIALGKSWTHVR